MYTALHVVNCTVAKLLSTKWPLIAMPVKLSAQLEARQILFQMDWVPREQSAEADAKSRNWIWEKDLPMLREKRPWY